MGSHHIQHQKDQMLVNILKKVFKLILLKNEFCLKQKEMLKNQN